MGPDLPSRTQTKEYPMLNASQTIRRANALWDKLGHAQDAPVHVNLETGEVTAVCAATAVMSIVGGDRAGAFRALAAATQGRGIPEFNKAHTLGEVRQVFERAAVIAESLGS
jgi:hypothetical protein